MIELRSIREFTRKGRTTPEKYDAPLNPPVNLNSIEDLIRDADKIAAKIPADERHNVFFTVGNKPENSQTDGRLWISQDVIPFDIDNCTYIDNTPDPKYIEALGEALQVDTRKCMIVATGNGLQVLIKPKLSINDANWFTHNEKYYLALSHKISDTLRKYGLEGELDSSSFATNRLFRFPFTSNIKPNKPTRVAQFLNRNLETVDWDLQRASGLEILADADTIPVKQINRLRVDTGSVEAGCNFLKHIKENQASVSEPQWYAGLSILARLEDGTKKCHEYSSGHPSYSPHNVDKKIEQSLKNSGPRTCDNINKLWSRCSECPNYKKVTSPILIKGPNFISTIDCGFHMVGPKGGFIPQYRDLLKFYEQEHAFINIARVNFTFNGTHWVRRSDEEVKSFAEIHFSPPCDNKKAVEFIGAVSRNQIKNPDFFNDTTNQKMNFQNGVLDIKTMKFGTSSPDYGFTWVLPYDYDPIARAPMFEKFMHDFTNGDVSKAQILQEYMGYAIAGGETKAQKFLTLVGGGGNGKSTFLEIITDMVGGDVNGAVAALGLEDIAKQFDRTSLLNARFNIMDESQKTIDGGVWEKLKNYVTGGLVNAAFKGKDAFQFRNKCKFILLVNDIPKGANPNEGLFRRFLIIECNANFKDKAADKSIREKIVKQELPGIFNWAIDGYNRLVANDYTFTESKSSDDVLSEYKLSANTPVQWFEDNIELTEEVLTTNPFVPWIVEKDGIYVASISKMRESFNKWNKEHGGSNHDMVTSTFSGRLNPWLESKGYDMGKKKRVRVDGDMTSIYEGLKLKPEEKKGDPY